MTITWTITETNYETSTGFIITSHWTASAVDGDYSSSIYATCSWQPGTPTIPYNQVTQQDVLDWCWASGVEQQTIKG